MPPLFVAALPAETAAFAGAVPILHVGVGKVQAAAGMARHLASHRGDIEVVVNVGTAGGLRGQPVGEVAEIGRVHQHDFDHAGVSGFVGSPLPGGPIHLQEGGARLATGDRLVIDPTDRARLAEHADLVDMEGYAIAAVCAAFDVPVRMAKAVSDSADADAAMSWKDALERCSVQLEGWAAGNGLLG